MDNTIVDIYFFTGTGNTFLAASKIAQILESKNYKVSVSDIAESEAASINLSHIIGIGFPIAFWNTFPIVKNFINTLPNTENATKVFIFTTMGDSSLNAASNFGHVLKNKGYKLIGASSFLMPNNFIAVQKESKNIEKREKAYKQLQTFAKSLTDTDIKPVKTNFFFKLCFVITNFITDRWKGKLFQKIVKFKIQKKKCIKCGLCAKICPAKNIDFNGTYPTFKAQNCQICMRCISYCPQKAIKSVLIRKTYQALNKQEQEKCFF
ncbi:MAG: EFR1 family ferrodoxin [Endomicrobium sp.]|uniref:EFR1 family ferrodoxin n=1 Tax=Candidatus Endomicrobiellum cubanum TaxID=3242325 RepID=UPI0028240245|nr:EFR1 family ferrodoxin [Endomicrobium sp.]